MTRIFSVVNQKGGVGKTTTVQNLGHILAQQGSVLLIDLDAQGSLTSLMGLDPYRVTRSSYSVLMYDDVPLARAVRHMRGGVSLLPGSIDLASAAVRFVHEKRPVTRLRDILTQARLSFDYILIDTPPTLDVMTAISLVASDEVIIPVQCHFLAVQGVRAIKEMIGRLRPHLTAGFKLSGILATMYEPEAAHARKALGDIRNLFPGEVFQMIIPYDPTVLDAPYHGKPVVDYAPQSPAAVAYTLVAEELLREPVR